MNILIAVNKNYLLGAVVMLKSLSMAVEEKITVYLLTGSLPDENVCDFTAKINKMGIEVIYIKYNDTAFSGMPVKKFSKEMYYRLIAQYMLPNDMDRILWLDADIIILRDISEFYHQSFDDKYMVVCRNFGYKKEYASQIKNRVGILPEHDYFNSGVLLLNLKKLRTDISMDYILNVCKEKKDEIVYPDQDILNFIYQGKVKYANERIYNYQVDRKDIKKQDEDIAILHYSGRGQKPWNIRGTNLNSKYWLQYEYAINGNKLKTPLKYYPRLCIGYVYYFLHRIYISLQQGGK